MRTCSKCGARLQDDMNFCTTCGTKYEEPNNVESLNDKNEVTTEKKYHIYGIIAGVLAVISLITLDSFSSVVAILISVIAIAFAVYSLHKEKKKIIIPIIAGILAIVSLIISMFLLSAVNNYRDSSINNINPEVVSLVEEANELADEYIEYLEKAYNNPNDYSLILNAASAYKEFYDVETQLENMQSNESLSEDDIQYLITAGESIIQKVIDAEERYNY